jgi:hypothetical protein
MEFISGAFSGIVQTIVGYPLDTIKVSQQNKTFVSNRYYNKGFMYALFSNTILNSILFKWFKDFDNKLDNAYTAGFISGSLSFPIVFVVDSFKVRHQTLSFPHSIFYAKGKSITFMCESSAMALYFGNYKSLIDCHVSPFMAGGISGTITWLIGYPLDVIKTRQLTYNITIKQAIQMGSFHKGLSICLLRAFLVNSFGFYSYEYVETRLIPSST